MRSALRFLSRLIIFLGIPAFIFSVFALAVPSDYFTFRSWETVLKFRFGGGNGAFYPNQSLEMIEVGDLGNRTDYGLPKEVVFITDSYGFRYDGNLETGFDIVIIGDSMTVGSSLTQADTVANQLANQSGLSVYPFAPRFTDDYMRQRRFAENPPDYVIIQRIEREMAIPFCQENQIPQPRAVSQSANDTNVLIQLDIFLRTPWYTYQYLRSLRNDRTLIANAQTNMVFFDRSLMPPEINPAEVAQQLLTCQQWLQQRGSQMIFLPIPDKETIYFDDIPPEYRPDMTADERQQVLEELIQATSSAGILTVDLLTAYLSTVDNGIRPYQLDDTHWNPTGVAIAVDLIIEQIDSLQN